MTISEVSEQTGLTADTLRRYERIGLLPPVRRTAGGARDYTPQDCQWAAFVGRMRRAGLSQEAFIDYASLTPQGGATHAECTRLLAEQRDALADKIEEMQETLAMLNQKINSREENTP